MRASESLDPYIAANARHALSEIGPQAVPFLLDEISYKDSKLMRDINVLLDQLPGDLRVPPGPAGHLVRDQALGGFMALGPAAREAVPCLKELLFDPEISAYSAIALVHVDPEEAVRVFPAALTNGNENICIATLEAVSLLETNAEPLLPILLQLSNSNNPDIQFRTVSILGRVGRNRPSEVLAVLRTALKTFSPQASGYALTSLLHLGPGAAPLVPEVFNVLTNATYGEGFGRRRRQAAKVLVQILKTNALPHLLELVTHEDASVAGGAMYGLGELGTNAAVAVPLLVPLATNQSPRLMIRTMEVLGKIESRPELTVPVLIQNLAHTNDMIAVQAAWVLSLFGTNAQAAVPLLTHRAQTHRLSASGMPPPDWLIERAGSEIQRQEPFRFALEKIDPQIATP